MLSCPEELVFITRATLDITSALEHISAPSCGASSVFSGTTRNNFKNKPVLYLEYECYEPMAVKEMKRVSTDLRSKYEVKRVYIAHRVGRVDVGDCSILIAASAPHRRDAISFVSDAIDRIKETVPVWKKEWYSDGSVWKENCECGLK